MLSQESLREPEGEMTERKSKRCNMADFKDEESGGLEKQKIQILEPSEGTQPHQHLDFSPENHFGLLSPET